MKASLLTSRRLSALLLAGTALPLLALASPLAAADRALAKDGPLVLAQAAPAAGEEAQPQRRRERQGGEAGQGAGAPGRAAPEGAPARGNAQGGGAGGSGRGNAEGGGAGASGRDATGAESPAAPRRDRGAGSAEEPAQRRGAGGAEEPAQRRGAGGAEEPAQRRGAGGATPPAAEPASPARPGAEPATPARPAGGSRNAPETGPAGTPPRAAPGRAEQPRTDTPPTARTPASESPAAAPAETAPRQRPDRPAAGQPDRQRANETTPGAERPDRQRANEATPGAERPDRQRANETTPGADRPDRQRANEATPGASPLGTPPAATAPQTRPGPADAGPRQRGQGDQTAPGGLQPGRQGAEPGRRDAAEPDRRGAEPGRQGGAERDRARDERFAPGLATGERRDVRVEELRGLRRERVEEGGRRVIIEEPGNRTIVREGNRVVIRHDETVRFRETYRDAQIRTERRGTEEVTIVRRPNGVEIVTIRDQQGNLVRRVRREAAGREVVLIENVSRGRPRTTIIEEVVNLPPPRVEIPREKYIVEVERASPRDLVEAFTAPPVERVERRYTLDEVRQSQTLRERVRRVDIDTVTFESGSWTLSEDQAGGLSGIAQAIEQALRQNPNEIFLIEGHTDAVGEDVDNLTLSDRRAETVAVILSDRFGIPAENLTTQGYGEQYLKVNTQDPARENRRVTIRNITPLLNQEAAR